jgi:hypothetical protein
MYQELKKIFEKEKNPNMGWLTDFTYHDRRNLTGYKGRFLWGLRDHGTELLKLPEKPCFPPHCKWNKKPDPAKFGFAFHYHMKHSNLNIWYCDGERIRKATFDQVKKIIAEYHVGTYVPAFEKAKKKWFAADEKTIQTGLLNHLKKWLSSVSYEPEFIKCKGVRDVEIKTGQQHFIMGYDIKKITFKSATLSWYYKEYGENVIGGIRRAKVYYYF